MGRNTHGPLLIEAIEANNLKLVSTLLGKHFKNRSKVISFLWSSVPRPLFENQTEVPMLLAAALPDPAILNYLVTSLGADVNHVYTFGNPKKRKQSTCLITAVRRSSYAVVSYLLNIGCDPNRADHKARTPLHHAVRRADFAMTKLLLSKGSNHDRIDSAGNTPLHVATLYGHTQLVRLLARAGADLYKKGHFGALPLHMAAREGHAHLVVLYCCSLEVNPCLKVPCYDIADLSPLHLASMRGHFETVKALVEDCGASVDSRDPSGNTALHYCFLSFYDPLMEARSKEDHAETCRLLLELGADPNASNAERETPLHLASKNGYEKGIETLLVMGANCGEEARNAAGNRPVDLLADQSGVSASILKTAARDPQGFLNETSEARSRRGLNSSANLSFVSSNGRHSGHFSQYDSQIDSPRLGISNSSPRLSSFTHGQFRGRISSSPGILADSHLPSMESINRLNHFSRQTSQIERSIRRCMESEDDGYLAPQDIPFIDEGSTHTADENQREYRLNQTVRPKHAVNANAKGSGGLKRDKTQYKNHLAASHERLDEDCRSETTASGDYHGNGRKALSLKSSENGSTSIWEVTPNASTISTITTKNSARNGLKKHKLTNGACNLSNVFEELSEAGGDNYDEQKRRNDIQKSINMALKKTNVGHRTQCMPKLHPEINNENNDDDDSFEDYDSFDTVSSDDDDNDHVTKTFNNKLSTSPTKVVPNQKQSRLNSVPPDSSPNKRSTSSSHNSGNSKRRRTPPPIPAKQPPYGSNHIGSCNRLINVEIDDDQLQEWTIFKFVPIFPPSKPTTVVLNNEVANEVIELFDNDRFLNKFSKENFNILDCAKKYVNITEDDFLIHNYENISPAPGSTKYVLKQCRDGNKLGWFREILESSFTNTKHGNDNKITNNKSGSPLKKINNKSSVKRPPVAAKPASICSESDSFISASSTSDSNEINSFVPKEVRRKNQNLKQQDSGQSFSKQKLNSAQAKKGFGLQKINTISNDTRKMRPEKNNESNRSIDNLDHFCTENNDYQNLDDAIDLKRTESQQNVLDWFSANQKSLKITNQVNGEMPLDARSQSVRESVKMKNKSSRPKMLSHGIYEQLNDDKELANEVGSVNDHFHKKSKKFQQITNKIVIFNKDSENLNFTIAGGNVSGILVKSVQAGSDPHKAGLKTGDEIMEINGRSVEGKTKEEAFRMLEKIDGRIELNVKANSENRAIFDNGDRFFIQACFDFIPDEKDKAFCSQAANSRELATVKQGEIFCVLDSLIENLNGWWKAVRADSNSKNEILIPNRVKAVAVMAKTLIDLDASAEKKQKGSLLKRSFRRNKSVDMSSKTINSEFIKPYRNVILVPPNVKRPVFISGLFSEAVCRRLITESPGLFEIPDKIVEVGRFVQDVPNYQSGGTGSLQKSVSNSSLSPVDVQPLKDISTKGKHAICYLSPKAIEFIRCQSDLNPIAIFLSSPNKQIIRDVASSLKASNFDARKASVVNSMFENSARFEKYYCHLFDAILPFRSDSSWFSILKDTIEKMQVIPKWRTVELLDEEENDHNVTIDEGTLVREKTVNKSQKLPEDYRHSKTTDDLPDIRKYGSKAKSQRKGLVSMFFPVKPSESLSSVNTPIPDTPTSYSSREIL